MNNTVTPAKRTSPRPASMVQRAENKVVLDGGTLSHQFFPTPLGSTGSWTGARRLLLGVLEDAIANWCRYRHASSTRGKRQFREACDWLWSDDRSWLYSFTSICEHLDLDPDYVRARLTQHRPRPANRQQYTVRRPSVASGTRREWAA
jgi:hypothetical protein